MIFNLNSRRNFRPGISMRAGERPVYTRKYLFRPWDRPYIRLLPSRKHIHHPPHHPILASRGPITQHSYRLQPDLISTQDRTGKGGIDIATGAVDNALWDMYAKSRKKHLWVVNMTPVCSILCKKLKIRLTLALGRTDKRHCFPVRPRFKTPFLL